MTNQFWIFALSLGFLLSACYRNDKDEPDLSTDLVALIRLDGNTIEEKSGITGNNHNVTASSNRHSETNKSMFFNRTDSAHISFGDLDDLSFTDNIFTISFWAKVRDTSNRIAILSKRSPLGPFEYSIDNFFGKNILALDNWKAAGGPTVYGIDPMKANAEIELNKWQHFAFVGTGAEVKVYLNGVLQSGVDAHNANNFFDNTEAPFVIGNGGGWGSNHYFDGSIDDIYIFKRVLDEEAVRFLAKM
jgi:hypothetical protein